MSTIIRFKPATEQTKDFFKPYQAILETQVKAKGYAPVDLTIFETVTGYYAFAHGAVMAYERYDNHWQARAAARSWYRENAHRFKCSQ